MKRELRYPKNGSLPEKVMSVLSLFQRATAEEVAAELVELQGTASEEGVAELTIATTETLNALQQKGMIKMHTEGDKKLRYMLI